MRFQLKFRYQLVIYSISLALLLLLLRWIEFRFLILHHSFEIYAGAIAAIFTVLGIWIALKLSKPKIETHIIEKKVFAVEGEFVFNQKACSQLGLSMREVEVLQLMGNGLSNQEIADRLFVSVNTIKTHSSRLFEKLEVKRRTQAIELGKKLALIT
jgi:DNA-binding CsgD family transcriptional regulator